MRTACLLAGRPGVVTSCDIVPGDLRPRHDLLRSTALQAVFLVALVAPSPRALAQTAPAATALPTGGQVIAGQARITATTGAGTAAMTVKQSTAYGAYDWKSFDIGKTASVTYQVPNSQSVSVNRVISPTSPSVIAGKLASNGVVVVQNQSGVVFTQGAEVNVNTLIASAPGISDANARAGRLIFDQAPRPGAKVENHGSITVAQTGLAALVAPQVANSGVIRAQMGRVVLAGAEAHTVDLYGDGLLSIDVTRQVTHIPVGADGKGATALVTNTGTIVADGGTILLTASAVDGVVQNLVAAGGTVRANTVGNRTGQVAIKANGGDVAVTGTILAQGISSGSKGGQVEINAPSKTVALKHGAGVDVSGKSGGGTAAIGTTIARAKGGPTVKAPTARDVIIESGARIAADATLNGPGGNVTILSQGGTTQHKGEASARGGTTGGDGGYIEVSGDTVALGGRADVTAVAGAIGTIVLDPIDLVITSGSSTTGAGAPTKTKGSITTKAGAGTTQLNVADILLLSGNIKIEAIGALTINTAVDTTTTATIGNVTFKAGSTITVNAPISIDPARTLSLRAGNAITLGADILAGTVDLSTTAGGVLQTAGSLAATSLLSSSGISGTLLLTSPANTIATLGKLVITGGGLALTNASELNVTGAVTLGGDSSLKSLATSAKAIEVTGSVALTSPGSSLTLSAPGAGGITLAGTIDTTSSGVLNLISGTHGVTQTGGIIVAGTLASSGGTTGSMTLPRAANAISTIGDIAVAGGNLVVASSAPVTVAGTVTANTVFIAGSAASASAISVPGTIAAQSPSGTVILAATDATAGGITLSGSVTSKSSVGLSAGAGGIRQTSGSITTPTLAGAGTIGASLVLASADNVIGSLGSIRITTGDLLLATKSTLDVAGTLTIDAGRTIALRPVGLTISAGTIAAAGGTVEIAPLHAGSMTLGNAAAAELAITNAALARITSATLRLGRTTSDPVVAESVIVRGLFDASTAATSTLRLDAGVGGITLETGAALRATTLDLNTMDSGVHGLAGSSIIANRLQSTTGIVGDVALATSVHGISALGDAKIAGTLALATSMALDINGKVAAKGASIESTAADAKAIAITGQLTGDTGAAVTLSASHAVGGIAISGGLDASALGTLHVTAGTGGITQTSGTVAAGVLTGNTSGSLRLDTSDNQFPSLGALSAGGRLEIRSAVATTVGGPVSATNVVLGSGAADPSALNVTGTINATGSVTLSALDNAGGLSLSGTIAAAVVDLNAGTGGITQSSGVLTASILQSSGDSGGSVRLEAPGNAIASLGSFLVGDASEFTLANSTSLKVNGPIISGTGKITLLTTAAGTLDIAGPISTNKAGVSLLATNPAGAIQLGADVSTPGGTIDLVAGRGVAQSAGRLKATRLASSAGIGGTVDLRSTQNELASLGNIAVTAGSMALTNTGRMAVVGTVAVTSGNLLLDVTDPVAGGLSVPGTIIGKNVTLIGRGATGAIGIGGTIAAAGTLDLSVTGAGGVSVPGTISAGMLLSSLGSVGTFSATNTANTFTSVGGVVAKGGGIALATKAGTGFTLSGPLTVDTNRSISIAADALTVSTGAISAPSGTVEIRANTGISLGLNTPGELSLLQPDITAVTTGTLRLASGKGAITLRADLDTRKAATSLLHLDAASGISLAGGTLSATNLEVVTASANVMQTAGVLSTKSLSTRGNPVPGFIRLDHPDNVISQVGPLHATGTISIASSTQLSIVDTIRGPAIALLSSATGPALALSTKGILELTSPGTITLATSNAAGISSLAGSIAAPGASTLMLQGSGSINQTSGQITTVTVETTGTIGSATFAQAANAISTIGTLTATGDVRFTSTRPLAAANPVAAANITLISSAASPFAIAVSSPAFGTSASGKITLSANDAAGGIALSGVLSATPTGVIDLSAGVAGVVQTAGLLTAGTLRSSEGIAGALALPQANNISGLGPLAAKGSITLRSDKSLAVAGLVSAGSGTALSLAAPGMTFLGSGALAIPGGLVEIGPTTSIATIGLGTALGDFTLGDLGNIAANYLRIGQATSKGLTNQAVGFTLTDAITPAVTTLELISSGSIIQTQGGLSVPILTAKADTLDIAQPGNGISTLGAMTVAGSLAIANEGTIAIPGTVSASAISLRSNAASAKALDIGGTLSTGVGGTIALTANNTLGGITLSGQVDATTTGTIDLGAGRGGIAQPAGTMTTGLLRSTRGSKGNVSLSRAGNAIATLGEFSAAGATFTLVDSIALNVTGAVTAKDVTLRSGGTTLALTDTGRLDVAGTAVLATTRTDSGIILAGVVQASTLDLSAGTLGINQTDGILTSGTLRSTSGSAGTVSLNQPGNSITSLGPFSVPNADLILADSSPLIVAGNILAGNVTLRGTAASTKAVAVTGSIATSAGGVITIAAPNPAGGIALSGPLTAPGGTLDLSAGSGGITQSDSFVSANTLRSSAVTEGPVALAQPANKIATLADFSVTGSSFSLATSSTLSIPGTVTASSIAILGTAPGAAINLLGGLSAPGGALSLTASSPSGGLSLGGTLSANEVNLTAGTGGIIQPSGSLTATTLRTTVTGASAALDRPSNSIAILGDTTLTNGNFVLVDGVPLIVAGKVTAKNLSLTDTASGTAIAVTGDLISDAGGLITLNANNPAGAIDLTGALNTSITGVVDLTAGASVIQTSGSITTGTLRSTGSIGRDITLDSTSNAVKSIGTLAAGGTASITTSIPLDISGAFSAATASITATAPGTALSITGSALSAGTMSLAASSPSGGITLSGTVSALMLDFSAGKGGISQSAGTLSAGTLRSTAGIGGTTSIGQLGNAIGKLADLSVSEAALTLHTGIPIDVAGAVSADAITIRSSAAGPAALSMSGNLTAHETASLAASAQTGGMVLTGNIQADTLNLSAGSAGITQSAGQIKAQILSSTSGATGAVTLGQRTNSIAEISDFGVTAGAFTLSNAAALTISGTLAADRVTITALPSGNAIVVPGAILTPAGGAITLTAKDTASGISLPGVLDASPTGTIDLSAGALGIAQPGGRIVAKMLHSTSGTLGPVTLSRTGNMIAELGDFDVAGKAFSLATSIALAVSGTVSANGIRIDSTAAGTALSVVGDLTALGASISLGARGAQGGLSIAGTITGDQLDLVAGRSGIAQPGGSIAVTTLRASANGGDVSLDRATNSIAILGAATVTGGSLTLRDSIPLTITGAIKADALDIANSAAGTAISVPGDMVVVSGGRITLAATGATGALELGGLLDSSATGILDISAGSRVTQRAGTVIAGTLRSGTGIGGDLVLAQPSNAIGTIAGLKVIGQANLTDSVPLTITGPLFAKDLSVLGTAAGTAISLTGSASASSSLTFQALSATGGIALSGVAAAEILDLGAGTNGITQTAGSIIATTLRSTTGSIGAVALSQQANKIASIDGFAVAGKDFALSNASPLTITGPLTATSVALSSSAPGTAIIQAPGGTLAANGNLNNGAGFLTIRATNPTGGITLNGDVEAAILDLSAGTGGVAQLGGGIRASTLRSTEGTAGSVTLLQPGNAIGSILRFAVSDGDFTLRSNTALNAQDLSARNVDLQSSSAGIDVASQGIATATGGSIRLQAAGALTLGNLNASPTGTIDLNAGAGIQQFGSSMLTAGTLRSSAGVTGRVDLSAGNSIGKLDDFAVSGGSFTLWSFVPLTVAGVLSATDITLISDSANVAAINIAGTTRTAPGGTIALASLSASSGVTISGTVDATTTGLMDLAAGAGGVTQTAGTIIAGRLQSSNGATGTVLLDQPSNSVNTLGPFTVRAGNLSLFDNQALSVQGPIIIPNGNLVLTGSAAGPALTVAGPVSVSGTAKLSVTEPTAGITLGNNLDAAILDLLAGTGGVTQTNGALSLATLQASSVAGAVTLTSPTNSIARIGTLLIHNGDATLSSAVPVTVAGTLSAAKGNISIVGLGTGPAAIDVAGRIASGSQMATTLATPNGGIRVSGSAETPAGRLLLQTASGVSAPGRIVAGNLSATTTRAGDVALAGPNEVENFTGATLANGSFLLNNTLPLTVSGTTTARVLGISATGSLRLTDGTSIITDGVSRSTQGVSSNLTAAQIAGLKVTGLGSYLAATSSFGAPARIELGKINVAPFSTQLSTLDLVLPHPQAGTISISQLIGKTTDLILITRSSGVATGTIDVAGLLVVGAGGKAELFGRIAGVDGQAAASRASISPQPGSEYRFNTCPISSVNCVLIPVQTVPPISPLRDIPIIRDRPTQDDTDVQLPNVSEEDY